MKIAKKLSLYPYVCYYLGTLLYRNVLYCPLFIILIMCIIIPMLHLSHIFGGVHSPLGKYAIVKETFRRILDACGHLCQMMYLLINKIILFPKRSVMKTFRMPFCKDHMFVNVSTHHSYMDAFLLLFFHGISGSGLIKRMCCVNHTHMVTVDRGKMTPSKARNIIKRTSQLLHYGMLRAYSMYPGGKRTHHLCRHRLNTTSAYFIYKLKGFHMVTSVSSNISYNKLAFIKRIHGTMGIEFLTPIPEKLNQKDFDNLINELLYKGKDYDVLRHKRVLIEEGLDKKATEALSKAQSACNNKHYKTALLWLWMAETFDLTLSRVYELRAEIYNKQGKDKKAAQQKEIYAAAVSFAERIDQIKPLKSIIGMRYEDGQPVYEYGEQV